MSSMIGPFPTACAENQLLANNSWTDLIFCLCPNCTPCDTCSNLPDDQRYTRGLIPGRIRKIDSDISPTLHKFINFTVGQKVQNFDSKWKNLSSSTLSDHDQASFWLFRPPYHNFYRGQIMLKFGLILDLDTLQVWNETTYLISNANSGGSARDECPLKIWYSSVPHLWETEVTCRPVMLVSENPETPPYLWNGWSY